MNNHGLNDLKRMMNFVSTYYPQWSWNKLHAGTVLNTSTQITSQNQPVFYLEGGGGVMGFPHPPENCHIHVLLIITAIEHNSLPIAS